MPKVIVSGYVPAELVGIDEIRMELLNALRKEGNEIKKDLSRPTRYWKLKPGWQQKVSLLRSGTGYVEVWTTQEKYRYVNDGTPPHMMGPILPVKGKFLVIPGGRISKTRPGTLTGRRGRTLGPYRRIGKTKRFRHPGITARLFNVMVVLKMERTGRFQKRIDTAIMRGLAKTTKRRVQIG